MRNAYESYVLDWIGDQDPAGLRRMAEADADATASLFQRSRIRLHTARAIIGRRAVERIRAMTDRDFSRLIDLALEQYPAQGAVLDDHEGWFVRQAKLARDRFLSG
jgi:hypothetical protein